MPLDLSRPAHDLVMRDECNHILEHPSFQNAPVLSRLLQFLVDETVAGRGNSLKGYSVAVDGLGKPDDFDSYADSYPRVQVCRLRSALEKYYAQQAPMHGLCLYLRLGSYRVRLGSPATAYPDMYRPLSARQSAEASVILEAPGRVVRPGKNEGLISDLACWKPRLLLAAMLVAAVALAAYALWQASSDAPCVRTLASSP